MDTSFLEEIGLNKSEVNAYLALLELGSSTTGIIAKRANVTQSKIYLVLERLMKKGLVYYSIKSNIKHFEAAEPKRILDYLNEKKERISKQEKAMEIIIPQLELKKSMAKSSEAQIYKGTKAVETALIEAMRQKDLIELSCIGDNNLLSKRFHKKREENNLKAKIILTNTNYDKLKNINIKKSKIKSSLNSNPTSTYIIGNEVILIPKEDEEPTAIVIKSDLISKNFKQQFEREWNSPAKMLVGVNSLKEIWEEILDVGYVDWIGARGYSHDSLKEYMLDWKKRAKEKNLKVRNIVDKEVKGHPITKMPFAKTKYTLSKEFSQMSCFWIYGDKVAISNWTDEEPIALVIENKKIVEMYKQQFESLWKK